MSFFVILENGKKSLKMTTMWQPKSKEQVQKNLGKQGEEDQGRGACLGSFGGPAWTRSYLPAWSAGPIQKPWEGRTLGEMAHGEAVRVREAPRLQKCNFTSTLAHESNKYFFFLCCGRYRSEARSQHWDKRVNKLENST